MTGRWNLDQLSRWAEFALEAAPYQGQNSGRVRDVPDKRTIRYYTTLGLLDRPDEFRGRTAYYGRRHVLQLAAIKRLQAHGMTLVQVQQALSRADDAALARWADLPDGFWELGEKRLAEDGQPSSPDEVLSSGASPQRGPAPFWKAPAEPAAKSPVLDSKQKKEEDSLYPKDQVVARTAATISLTPGATLVLQDVEAAALDESVMSQLAPILASLAETLETLELSPHKGASP